VLGAAAATRTSYGAIVNAPSGAVFLSYASEDALAAEHIANALKSAGIEVWFDQTELRGGDAWDRHIRERIRDCRLFIAVVSAHTEARDEGYFRREWKLAVDRTHDMAEKKAFLVPVVVDDTSERSPSVPEKFRELQWTRLPGGETPPAFVERIQRLLAPEPSITPAKQASVSSGSTKAQTTDTEARPPRRPTPALWVVSGLLAVTLAAFAGRELWVSNHKETANLGAASSPTSGSEKSVAVLPFTDLSEKHDQKYFSDGLAEELIDTLTRVPNLRVPARTSSFSFRGKSATVGEIGHALGVSHILEGSVRKSGERLRITAQLVRADNGFHLWSQTYDRDARDIFAVQDDIARAVSERLQSTLLGNRAPPPQQSTSPEAFTLYLQARHLAGNDTRRDLEQATTLYRQALELDPIYAPAWAALAECYARRVAQGFGSVSENHALLIAAANRAIVLNPALPDAYVALAGAYVQHDRNWDAGAEALAKARSLDPSDPRMLQLYGHFAAAAGRPEKAVEYFQRAVQADPLNLLYRKYLGRALHYARRPQESVTELRQTIALDPQFPGLHYELGRALMMLGDRSGAVAAFAGEPEEASGWRQLGLPLGYRALGDTARAQAALADLVAHADGSEFQVAEAYAFFGDKDRAFGYLDKALSSDPGVVWSRNDWLFDSISSDPRFAAYLQRLGMPKID
jgi:TolB-like protein/Tfp pilus assembly protein PilF